MSKLFADEMHQQTLTWKKKSKNALTVPVEMSLGGNSRESEKEGNLVDEEDIK